MHGEKTLALTLALPQAGHSVIIALPDAALGLYSPTPDHDAAIGIGIGIGIGVGNAR